MEAMVVSSGSLNVLEYAILNNIKQTLIQMKSFDEFISEKFDYTKQKQLKQNDFMNLQNGDEFYYIGNLAFNPIIHTHIITSLGRGNDKITFICDDANTYVFYKKYMVQEMGIMKNTYSYKGWVASTSKETLENFINSECVKDWMQNHKNSYDVNDNYDLIKKYKKINEKF